MAKYLVTGGAGFIGSHLCAELAARGHDLVVLDDLSTGKAKNVSYQSQLILGDVTDAKTVAAASRGVDGIFHLAAIASVPRCNDEWLRSHTVNVGGTVAVLNAARTARPDNNPIPVLYASSAAIYGANTDLPLTEKAVAAPLAAYGADKYGSELHAAAGGRVHGVPSCGLRFFNVFGPGQDPASPYSGVITVFIRAILEGRDITIFGDGKQTRDFVYVGDVVRHLIAAFDVASPEAPVFNVCTGRAVTLLNLVEALAGAAERRVPVNFAPPRVGDIRDSLGDPTRAIEHLGVRAKVSLRAGLARILCAAETDVPVAA